MFGGDLDDAEDAEDSSDISFFTSERECERIAGLPSRNPVEDLTPYLSRPGGTIKLNDEQNGALIEIGTNGGALISLPVGTGKTLISFLAAEVIRQFGEGVAGFVPPYEVMLLTKASIREQTMDEIEKMARHFRFQAPRVFSYSELSSQKGATSSTRTSQTSSSATKPTRSRAGSPPGPSGSRRMRGVTRSSSPTTRSAAVSGTRSGRGHLSGSSS